jgi:hypothetical protein
MWFANITHDSQLHSNILLTYIASIRSVVHPFPTLVTTKTTHDLIILLVFYSLPDESSSSTYTVCFFDVDVSFHCGAAPPILFLEPGGRPLLRPARLVNRILLSSTVKHVRLL